MRAIVESELRIKEPSLEFIKWCHQNLVVNNPEWVTRARMNLYMGNTPQKLPLFYQDGDDYILPYGCMDMLGEWSFDDIIQNTSNMNGTTPLETTVPLYEYQEKAVKQMTKSVLGVLQAPPGSGKTQIGLSIAIRLQRRTLWLTHTLDLQQQSYLRARELYPKAKPNAFGLIGGRNHKYGTHITFATVQTMSKIDPSEYKDKFDVVIVDECHRVSGTVKRHNMFCKVLRNCNARFKYGMSATVKRKDGLTKSIYAHLGLIKHEISREEVGNNRLQPSVTTYVIKYKDPREAYWADGTIDSVKAKTCMGECEYRNELIASTLRGQTSTLILGDRIEHLRKLRDLLPPEERKVARLISGKSSTRERQLYIEQMRTGEMKYLFATYPLAREGLDIPRLERLYLVSPTTDRTTLVQSIGRIERSFPDKNDPIIYDFADNSIRYGKMYRKRVSIYKSLGIPCWRVEDLK